MSASSFTKSVALGLAVLVASASPVAVALPKPRTSVPPAPAATVKKGPEAAAEYKKGADDLKRQGRVDEAIAEYQKALEADPTHLPAMQDLGRVFYEKGKWSDAASQFKKLATANPQDPAALYNLGYALRKQGDYAGSADALQKYTTAMPDDPDGYYALAEVYRKLGRNDDAAAQYDLYAQKETRPSESDWVAKAKSKSQRMRSGGVAVAMATPAPVATTREVEQPRAAAPAAGGLLASAPPVAAVSLAPTPAPDVTPAPAPLAPPDVAAPPVVAAAPVAPPAPVVAAPAPVVAAPAPVVAAAPVAAPVVAPAAPVVAPAAPAAATLAFEKPAAAPLRTRDPTAAIYKIREGDGMYQQKRFREALFAYQDAVKLDDQSTNAMLKLGLAYASLNYFQEAIKNWEAVLTIDPANQYAKTYIERAKPRLAAAAVPSDQPKPLEAAQSPAAAAAAPAAAAAAPVPAALTAVSAADDAAAKDAYRSAVQMMNQSRYPEAITQLGVAISKNPNFVNAYVARGGAYLGMRSYNEAAGDYGRALQLDATLGTPLYGLARVYERLNDRAKACDYYRRYAASTGRDVQPQLKAQAAKQAETICGG